MKQVLVSVEDDKYSFFIEVLKHFDFVKVEEENVEKQNLLKEIAEGMQMAQLASKEKVPTRSAKSFLNEL